MAQRLVISALEFSKWSPFMRGVLTDKDLAAVGLAAQVNLLGVDLVGNVDQKHVEVVVAHVVRLEDYLHFVGLICRNCSLFGNKDERHLFAIVFNSTNLAF